MAALPHSASNKASPPPAPAMLRLVQMAVLNRWRATGEDLYREVARLAELGSGQDVVVSGCGRGVTTAWLATRTGASVTGVDPDPEDIERAQEHAREVESPPPEGTSREVSVPIHLSYETAPLDDLPYETNVFDAAIGEPEIATAADPTRAIAELARVTKPMGSVVLLLLTWRSEVPARARELIVERLGIRPRLLIEWKQALRDAGVVDIQVDDWTDACDDEPRLSSSDEPADGQRPTKPQLNWQDKMQIVGHAFRRSGWREAKQALGRETELLRELARERWLGFSILKGVKWPHLTVETETDTER